MNPVKFSMSLMGLMLWASLAGAETPVVANVQMVQRSDGSGLVDITYDVTDSDSPALAVAVQFSADDGTSWGYPALQLTGDLGKGVAPGIGRHIVWNVGALPEPQNFDQFRVRLVASDQGILHTPHSPANVAIIDWSNIDWTSPANHEKYSRANFCMVMASSLWSNQFRDYPAIDRIKELNPDTKVIGYISAKSAQLSGEPTTANAFWHEWFVRTRPFWVYTTTGDTAQDWPANVLLNILDPACRTAMVETVMHFQRTSANKLDGVMWDYFNTSLWVYDKIPNLTGDPDMNGNGIGHWADGPERDAFRAAQVSLISALRDSLGEGFIQVFNGQRAYTDPTFASLADGALYELFPTLSFPQPNMRSALDPNYANNLFNARNWFRDVNGGPWILLSDPRSYQYNDMDGNVKPIINGNVYRVAAMLTGSYAVWHSPGASTFNYTYGWTDNDICVGEPTGPPVFAGNFIRRDFQYGRLELEWKTGRAPDPFKYKVWSLGQLVEHLAIPYHFP